MAAIRHCESNAGGHCFVRGNQYFCQIGQIKICLDYRVTARLAGDDYDNSGMAEDF